MPLGSKFRIIDVDDLGQPALVVNATGVRVLLLDSALTCEERTEILSCVVDRYYVT